MCFLLLCRRSCAVGSVHARVCGVGVAAALEPPQPGKTVRSVIEISNRSTAPSRYLMRTADWDFSADFSVNFRDDLQSGSAGQARLRPEVVVPGARLRHRSR